MPFDDQMGIMNYDFKGMPFNPSN